LSQVILFKCPLVLLPKPSLATNNNPTSSNYLFVYFTTFQ
jgi:hypothetical protein